MLPMLQRSAKQPHRLFLIPSTDLMLGQQVHLRVLWMWTCFSEAIVSTKQPKQGLVLESLQATALKNNPALLPETPASQHLLARKAPGCSTGNMPPVQAGPAGNRANRTQKQTCQ